LELPCLPGCPSSLCVLLLRNLPETADQARREGRLQLMGAGGHTGLAILTEQREQSLPRTLAPPPRAGCAVCCLLWPPPAMLELPSSWRAGLLLTGCAAWGFSTAAGPSSKRVVPKAQAPPSRSSCFASPTSCRRRTYPSFSLSARKHHRQHSTAVPSLLCPPILSYAPPSRAPEARLKLPPSSTPAIDAPRSAPAVHVCCLPSSSEHGPLPEGRCSWGCHQEPRSQDPSPCRTRTTSSSVRCGTTMGRPAGSAAPA
jgi:hypothetical protein